MRRTSLAVLAIAMFANACVLWLEAAAMAEVPVMQAGAAAWSMLTATHLGVAWTIGTGALIFSMGAMALSTQVQRKRRLVLINLLGLAAFLYTRSMVSHASANGDFSVPMVADCLHLILICLWVGEVLVAGFWILASPTGERMDDRTDCARYIESLSTSATFALAGIFATGLFSAWWNVGSPSALVDNSYGTTLLVKIALVLLAVMLGGVNRFIVMPSLIDALRTSGSKAASAVQRFTLILRFEAGVLLGVLILAALLSSTSPPTAG
jgi:putative copper resistance protein D